MDFPFDNKCIDVKGLKLPKARELAEILQSGILPFVKFEDCRILEEPSSLKGCEAISFQVEVELGQTSVHPINKYEKITAVFDPFDKKCPEVLVLRKDFPSVPHLNLREFDYPKSLCLYEASYEDVKMFWTPTRFIERIREWLAETAKGKLHKEDQLLEPLFIDYEGQLVISFENIENEKDKIFDVYCVPPTTLIADTRTRPYEKDEKVGFLGTIIKCPPQEYGVVNKQPKTIEELNTIVKNAGVDLIQCLQNRLREWHSKENEILLDAKLILTIIFPKKRDQSKGSVENNDIWSFLCMENIRVLGEKLGVWEMSEGKVGLLLSPDTSVSGSNIEVHLFRTMYSFDRNLAALQNNFSEKQDIKIVMVGAGALGSQIFMNAVRAGFGNWVIIDHDIMLPHNLARHALPGNAVGTYKANSLSGLANITIDGEYIAKPIVANVLSEGEKKKEVIEVLLEADLIIDCSASLPVLVELAKLKEARGRRLSMFLNPRGNGLVIFQEDIGRETTLDHLEMQYLRFLITSNEFNAFLNIEGTTLRYANSCKDISSKIPQEYLSLHASICSGHLKNNVTNEANISLWEIDSKDWTVSKHSIDVSQMIEINAKEWTIITDKNFFDKVQEFRKHKLPNETGGVLIGSFNIERKIVYVVDTVLSPRDSTEWPTVYVRGCEGLKQAVEDIKKVTLNGLEYVGEWHSHPSGCGCSPSTDDKNAFNQLSEYMGAEGLPAMMLIVGDEGQVAFYLVEM